MKTILVPCDFSQAAQEAFKFAVNIAARSKGVIHVLYVIDMTFLRGSPTLSQGYAHDLSFLKELDNEIAQKFQVMRGKYAPLTMSVTFTHVLSSLTSEIEKQINDKKIDLVVMGTHGEGHSTFGSNTKRTIRNSPVPVISLKNTPEPTRSIVFPLMPNSVDERCISDVRNLQNFFGARLHALYVNTPIFFKDDRESISDLEKLCNEHFQNYTVNVRSDYTVEQGVINFCKEIHADMVAMETHAWKGIDHFLLGSIAEDLSAKLLIPLWTKSFQ